MIAWLKKKDIPWTISIRLTKSVPGALHRLQTLEPVEIINALNLEQVIDNHKF